MATKAETELREILLNTGVLLPVKSTGKPNKVSVLCRQVPGQEKAWLKGLTALLRTAAFHEFEVHACRQYVLKDENLAFGWHLSIEQKNAKELGLALVHVRTALKDVEPELTAPTPQPSQPSRPPRRAQLSKELLARQKRYQRSTTAHPRQLDPTPDVVAPGGAQPVRLETIVSTRDNKTGKPIVEVEMPLPHTYGEVGKPNAKGAGAWRGDFKPMVGGNK